MTRSRKAISLFTGAGGLDIGFAKAGIVAVWANEIDKDACDTYSLNHDANVMQMGDLRQYIDGLEKYKGVDLVFGGPPCQGFSVAGKMDPNDERSKLIFNFFDVVEKVQPKAFIIENVKALGVLAKWKPIRDLMFERAKSLGYNFAEIVVLNATDYGVPQKRERMFFVAIKDADKLANSLDGFGPYLKKYQRKADPVQKIFHELGAVGSEINNMLSNAKITLAKSPILRQSAYAGMLFNGAGRPINAYEYANTLPASMGGNRTPIIDEEQMYNDEISWVETYHKALMDGEDPIFAEAPKRLRRITAEEAARIQTFPKDYKFAGRQNSIYKQIGNAVPCDLAFAVGSALQDALEDEGL